MKKRTFVMVTMEEEMIKRLKEVSAFKGLSMSAFIRMATLQAMREVEEEMKRLSKKED